MAQLVADRIAKPRALCDFSKALLDGIHGHRGGETLELADDITLLTMRRVAI